MERKPQSKPVINRYKMFKYGKHWVYAGITLASVGTTLLLTTNAQADAETTNDQTPKAAVAAQATTAALSVNGVAAPATSPTDGTVSPTTPVVEQPDDAQSSGDSDADTSNNDTNNNDNQTDNNDANNNDNQSDNNDANSNNNQSGDNDANSNDNQAGDNDANSNDNQSDNNDANSNDNQTGDNATNDNNAPSGDGTENNNTPAGDDTTGNGTGTTQPVTKAPAAATPVPSGDASVSPVTAQSTSKGPLTTTDDSTLDNQSTVTIEQTGPYAITWKKVSKTNQTEVQTVTLDASDFVALIKTINDATGNTEKLAAAKAKYNEMLAQLKALPSKVASELVGNLLYQVVFTGTGSQALSDFRTALDPTRYDISNTWTGLDPVAYSADRAAAETYYPAAVTWYNNATKETWALPEYNNPTQSVRATYIQNGASTKTVVIGQGWTERPDWIGYVSKIWYDMGYNILMPSQRGQFLSDGNDMSCGYQDKYAWLNWVRPVDERNGANSEVVFYGQSLGADTVIEAASVPGLSKSVKAVIADAGYATLPELGSSLYNKAVLAISSKLASVGLPAISSIPFLSYDQVLAVINNRLMKQQGFSLDDVSGVSAASKVTVPLMLIHTEDDAFIPYTQSLELAAANNSNIKTVWILPGAVGGHAGANNAVLQYTQHIQDFLAEALASETTSQPGTSTDETTPDSDASSTEQPATSQAPDETTSTPSTDQTTGTDSSTDSKQPDDLSNLPATNVDTGESVDDETTTNQSNGSTTNQNAENQATDSNADTSNVDLNQHNPVSLDPNANTTTSEQPATPNVDLGVLTATNESPVSEAAIDAAMAVNRLKPNLNAEALINRDQSGSSVTASLLVDHSVAAPLPVVVKPQPNVTSAPVATPTKLVDATQAKPAVAAASATTDEQLPQTADQPQTWLAALGASLAALATGLWASLKRRFNR